MPNYDPPPDRNQGEIEWEEIGRQQLAVRLNEEYKRLGNNIQTINRKISKGEPIRNDEIHTYRSELESFEGIVSVHLENIGEIDSDEPSEQIQRLGRGVLQALQEIARTLDSDMGLEKHQLDHAKGMLAEAEAEIKNLQDNQESTE